ncbi:arginase [Tropilaelaps mercedesae]|uniref:Arginase n=1 Tax=Tropilaelaps mercedesae TaxID=418985 RepID=A0A1V9X957_9ACAR|nr:arginase [Tropilaelaps mercedesae]
MASIIARRSLWSRAGRSYSVGVLGIPMWRGQKKPGTDVAPLKFRKDSRLITGIESTTGEPVHDFGDVDLSSCGQYECDGTKFMALASQLIRMSVVRSLNESSRLVVLGGDHSMAIGTVRGHADYAKQHGRELAVLWIDAHADINTPKTSRSGSWHGMAVSLILHEMAAHLPPMKEFSNWKSSVSATSLVYIGLRDVEPDERWFLENLRIPHFSMRELDSLGIHKVTEMALDKIDPQGRKALHVSFDIDALDPIVAPSTGTPVPGGMTVQEAAVFSEAIASTQRLGVLDVVEVNPLISNSGDVLKTLESASLIARLMLGTFDFSLFLLLTLSLPLFGSLYKGRVIQEIKAQSMLRTGLGSAGHEARMEGASEQKQRRHLLRFGSSKGRQRDGHLSAADARKGQDAAFAACEEDSEPRSTCGSVTVGIGSSGAEMSSAQFY